MRRRYTVYVVGRDPFKIEADKHTFENHRLELLDAEGQEIALFIHAEGFTFERLG